MNKNNFTNYIVNNIWLPQNFTCVLKAQRKYNSTIGFSKYVIMLNFSKKVVALNYNH